MAVDGRAQLLIEAASIDGTASPILEEEQFKDAVLTGAATHVAVTVNTVAPPLVIARMLVARSPLGAPRL